MSNPTNANALAVWHFAGSQLRDGRALPKAGDVLTHKGKVSPCKSGLHGSVRALDALRYAPGLSVARCELSGTIVPHEHDKHAASERRYLTGYLDAKAVVVAWALNEADIAVHVTTVAALRSAASADMMPDSHRDILRAKADELELLPKIDSRDAAGAASDAAWVASDAAWAARDAAWAARDAAWVVSDAAWAARDAAWVASDAAWAASDAAGTASAAAGVANDAAWAASAAAGAARNAASNERLEVALSALLLEARP